MSQSAENIHYFVLFYSIFVNHAPSMQFTFYYSIVHVWIIHPQYQDLEEIKSQDVATVENAKYCMGR